MSTDKRIDEILAFPGETQTIEFKRLGVSKNEVIERTLESIVAMANTDGGVIILGVDDPEKTKLKGANRIYGIEENSDLYDELGRYVQKISPPIASIWPPELMPVKKKEGDVRIGLLFVPKVTDGFRAIEKHVYVRLDKGNKRLSPQEIVHFAYVKGFERADMELVKEVDFNLLKTAYYDGWRRKRSMPEEDLQTVLEKTGLARRDDDGVLFPTRAAVLLFTEYPNDLMDTKCTIRIAQIEGNVETIKETLNWLGTPRTINGPVSKQISDAHEHVLTLLRAGMRVPSGFVTQFRIPERAIKEAITNAVIHRDYYTKRDIEVKIFEDRIEIESPGLLPFNITPSNIGKVRAQGYRNDLLVKHLREFPDPPNLDQNEGVRAMRESMESAKLYPPVFNTYPKLQDAVSVVFRNETAPTEWDKVAHYLSQNKYINNGTARDMLNIQDTSVVSRLLSRWAKQGLLVKVVPRSRSKRNTVYRLPASDEKTLFASH